MAESTRHKVVSPNEQVYANVLLRLDGAVADGAAIALQNDERMLVAVENLDEETISELREMGVRVEPDTQYSAD